MPSTLFKLGIMGFLYVTERKILKNTKNKKP